MPLFVIIINNGFLIMIFLFLQGAFIFLLIYAMVNYGKLEQEHLNKVSYFLFEYIPNAFLSFFRCSKNFKPEKIFGHKGPLRNLFLLLYYIIYHFLLLIFIFTIFPSYPLILQNPEFHHLFTFIIILIPWVIVLLLQFVL